MGGDAVIALLRGFANEYARIAFCAHRRAIGICYVFAQHLALDSGPLPVTHLSCHAIKTLDSQGLVTTD